MNIHVNLPPELTDIGEAIGLINAGGDLDGSWFDNPLNRLKSILTDKTQRDGVLDLLDLVLPPEAVSDASRLGVGPNEKWHPLLGSQSNGNLFLTVDGNNTSSTVTLGVGVKYVSTSAMPAVSVALRLPIAKADTSVSFIGGRESDPLSLTLTVALGWTTPQQHITLDAISVSLRLARSATGVVVADVAVTLQGLDIGGGAGDVTLDPDNLGPEATQVIAGLVCQQLKQAAATDLVALLGLGGSPPTFPFATIASDPQALNSWVRALIAPAASGQAPMQAWLGHLAALFGASSTTVTPTQTAGGMAWSVTLFTLNVSSSVVLTVTQSRAADGVTPQLTVEIGLALIPSGAAARFDASVALITVPLVGQSAATAFPRASLIVTAPGDSAPRLTPTTSPIPVKSIRAGVLWNGSAIKPLLELENVVFNQVSYPVINLTNANSVVATASNVLANNITAALGSSGAGAHLAALAGLIAPQADPTAPLVDVAQLAAHPTSAIAALHRNALLSTAHPWSNYFRELAALLSVSGAIGGSGTFADPWVGTIGSLGPLALQLAAWNAQTSTNASDPQLLRIGFRFAVANPSMSAWWITELLAVDMPANGANTIALLGAHHAAITIAPDSVQTIGGISLNADSVSATLDISAGSPTRVSVRIVNLAVTTPGGTVMVPQLAFPFPSGFDVQNPLGSLGISAADLENLVRGLLTRELGKVFGAAGLALATLLGGATNAPGLQADFPALAAPSGGSLFSDPVAAVRAWVAQVAVGLSVDGTDFASSLVAWLSGLLAKSLPNDLFSGPDATALAGSGTYEDPWLIPFGARNSQASGLLWLEPAGPPSTAALAAALVNTAEDLASLADAIASASRYLPSLPGGLSADALAGGLQSLADHLTSTDGVVPVTAQVPTGANWTTGTPITAPHHLQPSDPSACAQILAKVDAWTATGGQRAVLLLGPAFSDHAIWATLLAQAEATHPGTTNVSATFNMRVPNVNPASIDLRGVTAVADFYTADLQSDASGTSVSLVAQIGLIVGQISVLRPGANIVIVAHSTAGIAARLYAAANATRIKGLITLGTPHGGAPLTPLTGAATAEALRWYKHLFPNGVAAGPLHDALQHLLAALDGYLPAASSNALPIPWPYPIPDFIDNVTSDTNGVPALALGGVLGGGVDLLAQLQTAAAGALNGFAATAPTHLAYGLRTELMLGADLDVAVDAKIRIDVGRMALESGAAEPARAAHALSVDVSLARPGGWLVGGPLAFAGLNLPMIDVRVRSAELGLYMTLVNGVLTATPRADLHEASFHNVTSDRVRWGEAQLDALLGSVFHTITATAPAANTSLDGLLFVLEQFGIAAPDPHGGTGIAAGALNALTVDPIGYLAPKAAAAFAASATRLGFTNPTPNQYVHAIASLPLEAFVQLAPPAIGLRTIPSGSGLVLSDDVALTFSAALPLATMAPDITAALAVGPARLSYANATLLLDLLPEISSLQLYPPTATAAAAFAAAVETLVVSSTVSALVDSLLDSGYASSGLYAFFKDPGAWLVRSDALGDGQVLEPAKINALLQSIGQAIGAPAGAGLTLPGGLTLVASGKDPTTLTLSTASGSPLGTASCSLGVTIDRMRHLAPQGTITVHAAVSGSWSSVTILFSIGPSGITLTVTPAGSATSIQLLPTFSGAAALTGAAQMLLPAVLDKLVTTLTPASGPQPKLLTIALQIADALGIHDASGFAGHDSAFAALLAGNWPSSATATLINAVVSAFGPASPLQLPGVTVVASSANTVTWTCQLGSPASSGTVMLTAGWEVGGAPTVTLTASGIKVPNAPFSATIVCGYASAAVQLDASVDIDLLQSLGLAVKPRIALGVQGGPTTLKFLPLGAGTESTLLVQILPTLQVTAAANAVEQLLKVWGIPLVADILIDATQSKWSTKLWPTGPQITTVLHDANIVDSANKLTLAIQTDPFAKTVVGILSGLLKAIKTTSEFKVTDDLSLAFVDESGKLGVRLHGTIALTRGSAPQISLLFGKPADWLGSNAGLSLFLFTLQGADFEFAPKLSVRGLGLGVAGDGDKPLVNDQKFRVGAIDGYLAFEVDLSAGGVSTFGGGVEIDQLGLPLGLLQGANSSNPVASSLLGSDAGAGGGDGQAVNPGVDVIAYYLDGGPLKLKFGGTDQPIIIPVRRTLGPVYIDQIDVAVDTSNPPQVTIGIDGSVKVSTLTVGIDDLAVKIPLDKILVPNDWSLDLQGLTVGFSSGAVTIAGGLRKFERDFIEYDGMLSVTVADIGLTVVGSYARPSDDQGKYTSLFMFGAVAIPLGGPPYLFITGLGAGGGYNRELHTPTDMNTVGSFILVSAIDDGGFANDPMKALVQMSTSMPPRRGAFWLAAGVRFTTFQLVHSTVVVTIALDRGFEIDVLGISRMALPTEQTALVSVELALKARYNSQENLLSVQAQLTDNSYLFDRHCQLTGGFAFFIWFSNGQFILTLGGYNPSFSKPPQFPDVPRLGYNWSLGGNIVIKGGSYFALTNSCVMAGGSLSVTAEFGPVSAWFNAHVDFLVAWDPFAYSFNVGIEIGARFQIRVCLWRGRFCVTISMSISIGASLEISGPPFHGTATVDVHVTTITVSFGSKQATPTYISWGEFTAKYLSVGTPGNAVVSTQFTSGLLPPDPPGAQLQPGNETGPWKVGAEFSFTTTTRMPASKTADFVDSNAKSAGVGTLDIAPMNKRTIGSTHKLTLEKFDGTGWTSVTVHRENFTIAPKLGFFPEAMWKWADPEHLPAAARTITAVTGLDVEAHAVLIHESQIIPISTLVDDLPDYALALPFVSMAATLPKFLDAGVWAETVASFGASASSARVSVASTRVLAGDSTTFARNREAFGLPKQGLSPLAAASLRQRSAPPLLTPITTGLTMKPVGLAAPQLAKPVATVDAVALTQPRLRATAARVARPVADVPVAMSTSVSKTAAAGLARTNVPRMRPPALVDILGAQLIRVPAPNAPRPTKAALGARAMRNADFGAAIGVAHQRAFAKAASDLSADGVVLGAGAVHVWDVPDDQGRFTITGSAAVRMLCTDRAGEMLRDLEFVAAGSPAQLLPAGTALVAIECLGALSTRPPNLPAPGALSARAPSVVPGPGAVTTSHAPAGLATAIGWQNTNMLVQLGPACFAAHGATLTLPRPHAARRRGQRASYGTVRAADALRGQIAVETRLPATVGVVIIMLDAVDATASLAGDLAVAAQGATLASPPQRVDRGARRCLVYDVTARDAKATSFTVSAGSASGWSVTGVVGVKGTAVEWAATLQSAVLDRLIPEGAVATDGSATVKYDTGASRR